MLLFGHMGIGSRIVRPFSKDLPLFWIYLGTTLPDLIDKPLYYLFSRYTGLYGADLGLISGTRTFGHSGILLLLVTLVVFTGSTRFTALSLGMFTHVFLDVMGDSWELFDASATTQAMLFPLLGFKFYATPFQNMYEHWESKFTFTLISAEVIGLVLIAINAYEMRRRK